MKYPLYHIDDYLRALFIIHLHLLQETKNPSSVKDSFIRPLACTLCRPYSLFVNTIS